MDLAPLRMLIHELLNKDQYIVPEESPLIIFDSKFTVCMANNDKYNNHTRHIARRVPFVRNGEKCKYHNIGWFEGGLQLTDFATRNVGEHDLNPRMKYIILKLDNL